MPLKENLKIKQYILLTTTNMIGAYLLLGGTKLFPIIVLFFGIIMNQTLLVIGVEKLTAPSKITSSFKLSLIFLAKFGILVLTMIYALHSLPDKAIYCLLFYIFQLIILVISIKRIAKKLRK